jgi:hypothetical protein
MLVVVEGCRGGGDGVRRIRWDGTGWNEWHAEDVWRGGLRCFKKKFLDAVGGGHLV